MRSFQTTATLDPVPADVVALLRRIDLGAGSEARYLDQLPHLLTSLSESARVESITASSAIEGVTVDRSRVPRLASPNVGRVRNRSEAEFAGYTSALNYVLCSDDDEVSVGLILHLHRLLYSVTGGHGGNFKSDDNVVVDRDADGTRRTRFVPVPAAETPHFTAELVDRTNDALRSGANHPLVVVAAFVLDLVCIHPFADGNGRVARLVTAFLAQRSGYRVGRYVSVEQLIFETRDEYYTSLATSTVGWFDDGSHDIWPWTRYFLERLADAYDRLGERVAAGTTGGSKQDRVRHYVLDNAPTSFSMADIRQAVPGVSDNTIRLVLASLKRDGLVTVDGTGRSARWARRSWRPS